MADTITIKSLSGTRWSARAISTKVLHSNCNHILETLESIILDKDEKRQTQNEATALLKKMKTLDVAFMTELWHRIMLPFDAITLVAIGMDTPSKYMKTSLWCVF